MWTDDPVRDWDRHCEEQERWLAKLPKCDSCGDAIDEYMYVIDDEVLCENCMNDLYRKEVCVDED